MEQSRDRVVRRNITPRNILHARAFASDLSPLQIDNNFNKVIRRNATVYDTTELHVFLERKYRRLNVNGRPIERCRIDHGASPSSAQRMIHITFHCVTARASNEARNAIRETRQRLIRCCLDRLQRQNDRSAATRHAYRREHWHTGWRTHLRRTGRDTLEKHHGEGSARGRLITPLRHAKVSSRPTRRLSSR